MSCGRMTSRNPFQGLEALQQNSDEVLFCEDVESQSLSGFRGFATLREETIRHDADTSQSLSGFRGFATFY